MRKLNRLLLISQIIVNAGFAQGVIFPKDLVPASPNAASIGIFGSIPVGYYTGVPEISIPIYDIDLDGKKFPFSLSYHMSGIKVNQESSSVGLGWALQAGGAIIRQVQDDIDFDPQLKRSNGVSTGYFYASRLPYYVSIAYNFTQITNISQFVDDMRDYDTEPDLYTFYFGNHSGVMFTGQSPDFNTPANTAKATIRQPKEYLSMIYHIDGDRWVAQDGNGFSYYFTSTEQTQSFSNTSPTFADQYMRATNLDRTTFGGTAHGTQTTNNPLVSSWLLDSVVSPSHKKIAFTYKYETIETPISFTEKYDLVAEGNNGPDGTQFDFTPGSHYTYSFSVIHQAVLDKIKFEGGEIDFATSDRLDLRPANQGLSFQSPPPQKIENVTVKNDVGDIIHSANFNYSYLGDVSSSNTCRLLLNSVTIDGQQPYVFDYNKGYLPPKHSLNTDCWGYYNGEQYAQKSTGEPFTLYSIPSQLFQARTGIPRWLWGRDKRSDLGYSQHGCLNSVKYPTGGITNYTTELNTYDPSGSGADNRNMSDVNVAHIDFFIESEEDYLDPSPNPNNEGRDDAIIYSSDFTLTSGSVIHNPTLKIHTYRNLFLDDTSPVEPRVLVRIEQKQPDNSYVPVAVFNGSTQRLVDVSPFSNFNVEYILSDLQAGTYRMAWDKSQQQILNKYFVDLALIGQMEIHDNASTGSAGAGLRIKQIENITDSKSEIKTYHYDQGTTSSTAYTSGLLMTAPMYSCYKTDLIGGTWFEASSDSFTPFSYAASGAAVGYSYVEEWNGTDKNNGYTSHEFFNSVDEVDYVSDRNVNQFPVYPNLENGMPKYTTVYNSASQMLQQQSSTHILLQEKDFGGLKKYIIHHTSPYNPYIQTSGDIKAYWQRTMTIKPYTEVNTQYDNSGKAINIQTQHSYEPLNLFEHATITQNSSGDILQNINHYPFEFTSPINQQLVSRSMIESPVERLVFKNNKIVSGQRVDYVDTLNLLLPKNFYKLSTMALVPASYQNNYELQSDLLYYNNRGMPFVEGVRGKLFKVLIWGYNNLYPVADIRNVSYESVKTALGGDAVLQQLNTIGVTDAFIRQTFQALRSQLPNAAITSYTYKPLGGITSMTDAKGQTVYYEYDSFQRLVNVKDQNGKIIKHTDYHYQNQ